MGAFTLWTLFIVCGWLAGVCEGGNPPFVSFGPPSGNVILSEDAALGTSLFAITATDADSTVVTITIDPNNVETNTLVKLGNVTNTGSTWTVNVLLKAALDRDRNPNLRTLVFKVADDSNNELSGRVSLIIRDVNDNPPAFTNLPYRITLKENANISQTVFRVTAVDPDDGPGGSVRFFMSADAQGADSTYNSTFVIENQSTGDIIQKLPLDYEKRNYYQFRVSARDVGNPFCPGPGCKCNNITEPNVKCEGEPAIFSVTVEDVQDTPPFFERLPYIAVVYENASVGTTIFTVSAQDGDRGIPNQVAYSIVQDQQHPFTINSTTGDVTVDSPLDADNITGRSYFITVMAEEVEQNNATQEGTTNATTRMSITVLDVNDDTPQFKSPEYNATVQENTPRDVPITLNIPIEVTDKDQSTDTMYFTSKNENSQFVLSVEKDGHPYDVFSTLPRNGTVIQGTTTVIIRVASSSVLDYETTKNISFQLVVREFKTAEQFSSNTTITVFLEDMNDNSPIFDNRSREVNVTENVANGTALANFTATDADSGEFGRISYFLEDNMTLFAMDIHTGELSVAGTIDREERASYSLVVVATDNMSGDESNRRSTRLNVRVIVLDMNDNSPNFAYHLPSVAVQENAAIDTGLMTLSARDEDAGEYGHISYGVLSSVSWPVTAPDDLFAIDLQSGRVFVNASLIGYSGNHNVTFVAYNPEPERRNGTTVLTIVVTDVNLNTPVFIIPDETLINTSLSIIPNVTVDEGQPQGTVFYSVTATDDDQDENGRVYYSLDPDLAQNWQNFRINQSSGMLTNVARLDRETHDSFLISIKAEDNGSPNRLSKVIPLRIFLRDIDDNNPKFDRTTYELTVPEKMTTTDVGFVNISTDADMDSQNRIMCYYLYAGKNSSAFSLNATSGMLFLKTALDRETTPSVELVVKVTSDCSRPEDAYLSANNSYNSSDNTLLKVTVTVLDINDNPPVFRKDAMSVGLLYDVEVGTSAFELKEYTDDGDTPEHSKNMYRLLPPIRADGGMPQSSLNPVPFEVSGNGSVRTSRLFAADLTGYFALDVQVYDVDNYTDTGELKIYLVSNIQRMKLVSERIPEEARKDIGNLTRALSAALNLDVLSDKIATHITSSGQPDPAMTDIYIHARRRPSGEIVPVSELENAIDFNLAIRDILRDYKIRYTESALQKQAEEDNTVVRAFIIVAVVLGIVCLVLIVVLVNTIRRYHRRLRAATTSAYTSEKQAPDVYVPPGTNKYFSAENPLFGKDVKVIDVDNLSVKSNDSLDNNAVAGTKSANEKEKEEEQEMYMQLYDDEGHSPGGHVNHLAMVLNEYDRGGQPADSVPSSPSAVAGMRGDDNWKTSTAAMNGHVKSDSGFNEQGPVQHADDFKYTDI